MKRISEKSRRKEKRGEKGGGNTNRKAKEIRGEDIGGSRDNGEAKRRG